MGSWSRPALAVDHTAPQQGLRDVTGVAVGGSARESFPEGQTLGGRVALGSADGTATVRSGDRSRAARRGTAGLARRRFHDGIVVRVMWSVTLAAPSVAAASAPFASHSPPSR